MSKIINILILSLFVSLLACENLDISDDQAKTFKKVIGSGKSEIGKDVKEFNGGYLILATITSEKGNKEIVLYRTDKFGNPKSNAIDTLSSKRGGDNISSKLLLTNDGGFIVLGTIEDTLNKNKDIYINKFNSSFISEWEKFIGNSSNEESASIKKAYTGYIIAGSTDANGFGKDIYIVKTDDLGEVEWSNSWTANGNDYSSDVITIDNGYFIIGTTNFPDNGTEITFIKTNLTGTSYDANKFGGDNNDYGISAVKTEDGGFIIVGNIEEDAVGNSNIKVLKVDESLRNILWNRNFGDTELNDQGFDIVKTNGEYIVVGTKELPSGSAAYFLKIDGNTGETLAENIIGGYGQTIYSIEPTFDGGFIMTGSSGSAGHEMIYLLKVNSEGEL